MTIVICLLETGVTINSRNSYHCVELDQLSVGPVGPTVCWIDCLLDRLSVGPTVCWTDCLLDRLSVGPTVCWTDCLLDRLSVGPTVCWTDCLLDRLSFRPTLTDGQPDPITCKCSSNWDFTDKSTTNLLILCILKNGFPGYKRRLCYFLYL